MLKDAFVNVLFGWTLPAAQCWLASWVDLFVHVKVLHHVIKKGSFRERFVLLFIRQR